MDKSDKHSLGLRAEDRACVFLNAQGFEIVERNYRYKRGEIDIIASNQEMMIFVEVKYRSNLSYGNPEDFVSENQKRLVIESADNFLHNINWKKNIRFDIIAINSDSLEHFTDAFY
ncbi:YraN family protein [Reichenbachiella sp. MALMAid0571]|uniref:YraN family protein n=1 Tax=Reichenbachiella sp. MALMAid0571 TaxID=3143939 RepID=UPI0032DFBAEC